MKATDIKESKKIFSSSCEFKFGITEPNNFPNINYPEFALFGRSNVGKSTLLNSLTKKKKLARTSKNPGCTQQINYFLLAEKIMLVDLPGYGYAKVSKAEAKKLRELLFAYFQRSKNLKKVLLLIDARFGLKEIDLEVVQMFIDLDVKFSIIFTKTDKIKEDEKEKLISNTSNKLSEYLSQEVSMVFTSSQKMQGIKELKAEFIV